MPKHRSCEETMHTTIEVAPDGEVKEGDNAHHDRGGPERMEGTILLPTDLTTCLSIRLPASNAQLHKQYTCTFVHAWASRYKQNQIANSHPRSTDDEQRLLFPPHPMLCDALLSYALL